MNCLEFRRRCLAEPGHAGTEFLAHESECENCRRFAVETRAMESKLAAAIRIDVPANLAERIRRRLPGRISGITKRPFIALAASVLIAAGFFGGTFYATFSSPPLQAAVTRHIEGEWEPLVAKEDMDVNSVKSVLSTIGATVDEEHVQGIRFASLCDFSEFGAAHLIFRGEKGPVLALIIKEKNVSEARFMAMSKPTGIEIEGILIPGSKGSTAIVGRQGEGLQAIEKTLRDSVFWLL